jgi:hypothetical protein
MSGDNRLKRLRDLVAQLERLPVSDKRDRMLREVRGRIVDLDTGVTPRAMLPLESDPAAEVPRPRAPLPEPPRPEPVAEDEAPSPPRVEIEAESSSIGTADVLAIGADDLLFLDDPAPFAPEREGRAGPAAAPWTRGLRG